MRGRAPSGGAHGRPASEWRHRDAGAEVAVGVAAEPRVADFERKSSKVDIETH